MIFYALVALNALFASMVWCVVAPNRASLTALVVCSVAWVFVNGPLEGHILWALDDEHGVTASDILSVVGVIVAVVKYRQCRGTR